MIKENCIFCGNVEKIKIRNYHLILIMKILNSHFCIIILLNLQVPSVCVYSDNYRSQEPETINLIENVKRDKKFILWQFFSLINKRQTVIIPITVCTLLDIYNNKNNFENNFHRCFMNM